MQQRDDLALISIHKKRSKEKKWRVAYKKEQRQTKHSVNEANAIRLTVRHGWEVGN